MMPPLSANTKAILLLTAPLIARRGTPADELLTPGEYKRLARHLRELNKEPADLMAQDAQDLLHACQPLFDSARLQRLLGRGFLLSQAIDHWQTRAIWVLSRADSQYPRRLKARLREDAPAILYGCGDLSLLDQGGLALVGSRNVDQQLIDYTIAQGRLAATAGRSIVSGGAKGIDQAAMNGALEADGNACGVLADSLEKSSMQREHRYPLLQGRLVLASPFDPAAGFNVGNAMQRNKIIYALADLALVVNSDLNKGGTWAEAKEQLGKYSFLPIYIRSTGNPSEGLEGLHDLGALPWPNPQDADGLNILFNTTHQQPDKQSELALSPPEAPAMDMRTEPEAKADIQTREAPTTPMIQALPHSEMLFSAVRTAILQLLTSPMNLKTSVDRL